jgi:hypothetical protein
LASVERTFTVTPAPDVVLAYLADFANTEQWDPGTEKTTRVGDGPVAVGATWENTSRFAGRTTRLTYRLTEQAGDRLVFVGENKTVTSTDTITARPAPGGGSAVTYHVDLALHGAAKLADPALKLAFEKIANDARKQMVEVLNRL